MAEHKKNARPSTREKHQDVQKKDSQKKKAKPGWTQMPKRKGDK